MLIPIGFLGAGGPLDDYENIATQVLSATSSTVSFSNIPNTYRALELRISSKSTDSTKEVYMRFNNDSGANYSRHQMLGTNGQFFQNASGQASQTSFYAFSHAPVGSFAQEVSPALIHIAGYKNSQTMTSHRTIFGETGVTATVGQTTGQWSSLSTVTDISLFKTAGAFSIGSIFSLYGYKV